MSTVPAASAGAVAETEVAESAVTLAAVVPNLTEVAPLRLVPVMVTGVPPAVVPDVGLIPVRVGGVTKVYLSADDVVDVPPGVVTVMSTVPAASAGAVAVMEVAESAVTLAAVVPNLTEVAPLRLVPVMVTGGPPAVVPDVGSMPVT